jgi:hypothetical protein
MLNTHCFLLAILQFYDSTLQCEYITPRNFMGSTSMTDQDQALHQTLLLLRYAELENPIMYSKPDYTTFM